MVVTEKIQRYIQRLPISLQSEVLDYVEYLLAKVEHEADHLEEKAWADLSLNTAMHGMENDADPNYTISDLKVIFG